MNIIEPDVFYSDIALGIILFLVAYKLLSNQKRLSWCFIALGLSTFFGAFYHGYYNTTQIFIGDILWSITMIMYALSSFLFIHFSFPRRVSIVVILFATFIFSIFTTTINESFIYGLILQLMAIATLGYYIYKTKQSAQLYQYGSFVLITLFAIYVQQQKITFGLPYSHNTLFHIFQIPAIILLYLSLRNIFPSPKSL